MPANLTMENGKASVMYYGDVPWHGLGTKLMSPATSKEAIVAANLNWNVVKIPLFAKTRVFTNIKDLRAMITDRDLNSDTPNILGTVGKNYTPVQNTEAFAFFDSIVGGEKAIYHTAGSLNNNKVIWILARLPGEIKVIGDDITNKYLLLCNSHDGSSSVQIKFTPVRVVCSNTLTAALMDGYTIKIKHSNNVLERLKQSKQTLGIIENGYKYIGQIFKEMVMTRMSKERMHKYFTAVFPDMKDEKATYYNRKNRTAVEKLSEIGYGTDIKGVKGTLWGAYNAVTEFVDHKPNQLTPDKQLYNIWFGSADSVKRRAFRLAENMKLWLN
ncbi:MAG: DUF932 domain-containing protein [Ignavibacteriae bacterium]|nr:MAG: DUF932 domain-containing protein [Ignavibacteriota bacterium]